ncbi:hypothetical protein [Flectobacillus major]|uniref:hypothetical protein n=1 Tax=Flectobacillus major TaxID=103 RepID=UPI000407619B|nr:hypothetical protein [Flectobacillus major]
MKKLLIIFFLLSTISVSKSLAQEPVVIKQDGAVGDLDSEEEPDVRDLPFRQRLRFGGGIGGLQFGNPTVISVSPMAGYLLTNEMTVGLAVDYQYTKYRNVPAYNLYGPRVFGQYRLRFLESVLSKAFAQGEVQQYYGTYAGYKLNYDPQVLAGIGIGYGGFQLTALYNFSYSSTSNSPYGSPIVIRVGGFFF